MCGIAGVAGPDIGKNARESVEKMLLELERRGPDDVGIESSNGAVLGHRRLSIFDLSAAGHQPMASRSQKSRIVFNGAIYNFRELRKELENNGLNFRTQTDTEVLLEGFESWGIDGLLSRIDGMFAFALWDETERSLYLVRDRLGVKPLVYFENGRDLAFASTVRTLRSAGFCGELSDEGLADYFEFGFITDQNSIYKGVRKLPPASVLTFCEGKSTVKQYWDLPDEEDPTIEFEDAVRETERLFLHAVEKRLFADVPVGALLSGGIDSSLVCWAVAKLGGDVTAFTVGVPGDRWDESMVAADTAGTLGIKHHVIEISGETPMNIDELSSAFSEPFACASALGLLDISREVRKRAKVLLTGDGGDDIFLGYPEHLHFQAAESLAKITPESLGPLFTGLSGHLPGSGRIQRSRSFLTYAFGGLGGVTRVRDGLPVYREKGLLGERLISADVPDRSIPLKHGSELLKEFLEYDKKTRFTGEYLPKVDGGTMYYGLEARSPFLDVALWEYANSVSYDVRLDKRNLKAVLRELVKRHIGPELAGGAKQGFGVPVQRWITKEWNQQFRDLMEDARTDSLGFIDSAAVLRLLADSEKTGWAPRQLWFILVLENWLRREGI